MALTFVAISENIPPLLHTYVLINQQGLNHHYLFHYLDYYVVNLKVY